MEKAVSFWDSLFGQRVNIDLAQPDGSAKKISVTRRWKEQVMTEGLVDEVTDSIVTVNIRDSDRAGIQVDRWRIGVQLSKESHQKFLDPLSKELYALTKGTTTSLMERFLWERLVVSDRSGLEPPFHWKPSGKCIFAIVGESYYQAALTRIVGPHGSGFTDHQCMAMLIPEDNNPHDWNAVVVKIEEMTVGHLSRSDAVKFRRRLWQRFRAIKITRCNALIVDGPKNRRWQNYSVIMDLDSLS